MSRRKQVHVVNIPEESEDEELSDEDEKWVADRDRDPLHFSDDESEEDSDSSSQSDDVAAEDQPSTSQGTGKNRRQNFANTQKKTYNWVAENRHYREEDYAFLGDTNLPDEIKTLKTPSQLFDYFFTPQMISLITDESNRYAQEKDKEAHITELEIRQFIGILTYMSVIHYPTTRHYWKTGMDYEPIARTMTCNRFEELKRFTHFVDNSTNLQQDNPQYDKLQKIRPLLSLVRERLLLVPKEEYLAVDEQIIPTKTRQSSLKQYNPKKPHKWGYKVHVLSGVSGFSYDFDIYAGKQSDVIPAGEKNIGTSSNVVLRLTQTVPEHLNYKVFFDNWFTSVDLMVQMDKKGILPLGTVRSNRLRGAKLPTKQELAKKGRGSAVELQTTVEDTSITVVSWLDNKVVNMCSTYVGIQPTATIKRFNRKRKTYDDVNCPRAIILYNRHMGGVDTLDSMLGYYRIKVRSKKWYMRVYFHLIDVVLVNSWLIWRRSNKDTYMPLLDFKLTVAEVLTQKGSLVYTPTSRGRPRLLETEEPKPKRSRKRLDIPPREVAEDGIHHFPEWKEERQVCKNMGCQGKTYVWCLKCKVHLCLNNKRNCYMEYHVV